MGDNETDELQDGIEEELPEQDDAEMDDGAEDEAQGFNDSPSYAAMVADEDYAQGTDSGALDTGDGFESDAGGGMSSYGKEELYDLDESPEPDKNNAANFRDDSADFNEFGGSGNEYNQQFGNNSGEVIGAADMGADNADDEVDAIYQRDLADAQALANNSDDNFDGGDDETPQENFDGNEGEDEEEQEEENADGKEQGEGEQENDGTQNAGGKVAAAGKEPDGPIKWKKGDEITLDLLYQVWSECKFIEKIKSLVDAANKAIMEAINTTGPNLALRLNDYISKVVDKTKDTIDCLLDLAKKNGKRMVFVATSVVEAFFTQQWLQTGLLATLPKVLQGAIATNPLKGILNSIFTVAVPIINKKAQSK